MIITIIDIIFTALIGLSIIFIIREWDKLFSRDSKIFLMGLFLLLFSHGVTNILQWSNIYPEIDIYGDFIVTMEPMLWLFFFYSFIQYYSKKELEQSREKYKNLFYKTPIGILYYDQNIKIL